MFISLERDELFKITFEFKWKQPATKGLLTNNFCPLNIFWLSKKPLHPTPSLFLTYNIKLDKMPTKTKWKIQACFILYFKFFEGTSVESYKIYTATSSFISCFTSVFISADIIFLQLFRASFNIIWKRFSAQIFLF